MFSNILMISRIIIDISKMRGTIAQMQVARTTCVMSRFVCNEKNLCWTVLFV